MAASEPTTHILGIRHHGPGSARAVQQALDELRPDAVLIEGPPELDKVVELAADPATQPPIAGLVYVPDQPKLASFYPFASFSPEWVAMRWALQAGVPVHFADLPAVHSLAMRGESGTGFVSRDQDASGSEYRSLVRLDPMGALASAAGHDDAERWWEDTIEHRYHGAAVFGAVLEAMISLREDDRAAIEDGAPPDLENELREASMRKILRATLKSVSNTIDEHGSVAFICGAWHAPALVSQGFANGKLPALKDDNALLKNLPKVKVAATWVPWTSGRLARSSGYGAGIQSPGWYQHLFSLSGSTVSLSASSRLESSPANGTSPDVSGDRSVVTPARDVSIRWMVKIARLLRGEQLDASSASVIEAVRLADTLAAVRDRPIAGLSELSDAARAVLAGGSDIPLDLIAHELLVGTDLGQVPPQTPMVPLAEDLARIQKRLRLKSSAAEKEVNLDLRQASQLERSTLFHRLAMLGIPWGEQRHAGRTTGTFRETWKLQWQPEFAVAVIEASGSGTTIETAAAATVVQEARDGDDLGQLTQRVERCLLADLPEALGQLMDLLAERTARHHDTPSLMSTIEPLARVRRYGNVRSADTESVQTVIEGLLVRIAVGLPGACSSIDDEAVPSVRDKLDSVQRAIGTLDDADLRQVWEDALLAMVDHRAVHGILAGRGVRSLLDAGRLDIDDVRLRLSRALSQAADPAAGAGYLEGFLAGDALLLLHDPELLGVIDGWVRSVTPDQFDAVIPLLRRSFSDYTKPERRMIGEHLKTLHTGTRHTRSDGPRPIDADRAARVHPVLQLILGPRSGALGRTSDTEEQPV